MFYMYNWYSILPCNEDEGEYFTEAHIKDIELKSFDTIDNLYEYWDTLEEVDGWWCVYDYLGFSTVPIACIDEEDAKFHILDSLNHSLYEKYHDL